MLLVAEHVRNLAQHVRNFPNASRPSFKLAERDKPETPSGLICILGEVHIHTLGFLDVFKIPVPSENNYFYFFFT